MSLKDPNVVDRTRRKRVAIVLSNPAVSTTTGWPVGFWWYLVLRRTEAAQASEV